MNILVRAAERRSRRRHVHDCAAGAAASGGHRLRGVTCTEDRADEVDVDDRSDRRHRGVREVSDMECRARIVDEAAHRPQGVARDGEQPGNVSFSRDVGRHRDCSSA